MFYHLFYNTLLKQINQSGHTPILLNFRKPAISSNNSLNIIKKTNSLVFSNDMLQIDEKLLSKKIEEKSIFKKINKKTSIIFLQFPNMPIEGNISKNFIEKIANICDKKKNNPCN